MSRFLRNLVILGLAPILLVGLLVAWVVLTQPDMQQEGLQLTVPNPLVLPWQDAVIDIQLTPSVAATTKVAAKPVVFLVDISGSMTGDNLQQAKYALAEFVKNISGTTATPLGIVFFNDQAHTVLPLTDQYQTISAAIDQGLQHAGGGTNFLAGLQHVLGLLAGNPPATVLMLTDGAAAETEEALSQFFTKQWQGSGNELYLLGVGSHIVRDKFRALTDNPGQYIVTRYTPAAIADVLSDTARRIGNVYALKADFHTPFNEALVVPARDPELSFKYRVPGSYDTVGQRYSLPVIFNVEQTWSLPLTPQLAGVVSVFTAPFSLQYTYLNGDPRTLVIEDSPKLVLITWWMLFFLMLPGLLYLLAHWLQRLRMRNATPLAAMPQAYRNSRVFPSALKLPMRDMPLAGKCSPALIVGVGGSGREVLSQIQQDLGDSFEQESTQPVLLSLDLAAADAITYRDSDGGSYLQNLSAEQVYVLAAKNTQLKSAIQSSPSLFGLDLRRYLTMSSDRLSMESGSYGDPLLSKVSLLKDFADGTSSELYQRLQQAIEQWKQKVTGGNGQLVVVANANGGVGRGWLVPLAIMLRKMVNDSFAADVAIEISIVLMAQQQQRKSGIVPISSPELMAEIDLVANAGKVPVPYLIGDPRSPFVARVERKPWDNIFVNTYTDNADGGADGWADGCVSAAQATAFLLRHQHRTHLAHTLQSTAGREAQLRAKTGREQYSELNISTVNFPGSFFQRLTALHTIKVLIENNIILPKLKYHNAQWVLPKDDDTLAQLLAKVPKPDRSHWHLITAIKAPANNLGVTAAPPDLLAQAEQCKVALLAAINEMLLARTLSVFELPAVCRGIKQRLAAVQAQLQAAAIEELVTVFTQLERQSEEWLEVVMGTEFAVSKGMESKYAEQPIAGLMQYRQQQYTALGSKLRAWQKAPTRNISLWSANEADPLSALQQFVEDKYQHILASWTGQVQEPLDVLRDRFVWQINSPGADGQAVALNFSVYSSGVYRYAAGENTVARLFNDLQQEIASFLYPAKIAQIMQQFLERELSDAEVLDFCKKMKGDIEGIRQQILVSMPTVPSGEPQLAALKSRFNKVLQEQLAGAAEKIAICESDTPNQMGLLRLEPLLSAADDPITATAISFAQHASLHRLTERYCSDREIQVAPLPLVLSLALDDQQSLRAFAAAVTRGRVWRDAISALWCFYDGGERIELTLFEQDSVATAAAVYVLQYAQRDMRDFSAEKGEITQQDEDVIDFLRWYLEGDQK